MESGNVQSRVASRASHEAARKSGSEGGWRLNLIRSKQLLLAAVVPASGPIFGELG